jgi:hypothetical protein
MSLLYRADAMPKRKPVADFLVSVFFARSIVVRILSVFCLPPFAFRRA